jgi:hypothetical protein
MAAIIRPNGQVRQLDRPPTLDEVITEADVQDPSKLARLLLRLVKDVTTMLRRFWPRRVEFEDWPVGTAGEIVTLIHGFEARVRWYVVDWRSAGTDAPVLIQDTDATTPTKLVLASHVAGTATIRVEVAG